MTVLSTQIFLAVIGEYDYQKASALSLVLLIPTLVIFLVQRYYVNRRSYISVTGKPTSGTIVEKSRVIRWIFISITYLTCALIILLYATIIYGSFSTAWGVDFTPTLRWWNDALTRGVEAILDTTFLSAAGHPGCGPDRHGDRLPDRAQEVQRQRNARFWLQPGRGGARHDPGHRLYPGLQQGPDRHGHRSCTPSWRCSLSSSPRPTRREQLLILILGTGAGLVVHFLTPEAELDPLMYIFSGGLLGHWRSSAWCAGRSAARWSLAGIAVYLALFNLVEYIADADRRRQPPDGARLLEQCPLPVLRLYQSPLPAFPGPAGDGCCVHLGPAGARRKFALAPAAGYRGPGAAVPLFYQGMPLALTGTPYIILAAYIVRSLPASVRAGCGGPAADRPFH